MKALRPRGIVILFTETDDGLVHHLASDTQQWWVTQNLGSRARALAECGEFPTGILKKGAVMAVTCIRCFSMWEHR